MKAVSSALVACVAMLALARSTEAVCAAQTVFDACMQLEKNNLATCGSVDWNCQCQWEKAILTCYDDCKDDPTTQQQATIQQGQVTNICTAANTTNLQSSLAASAASSTASVASITTAQNTSVPATSASVASTATTASGTPKTNAASTKQLASGVFAVGVAALAAALAL